jgi:hypothetical protein
MVYSDITSKLQFYQHPTYSEVCIVDTNAFGEATLSSCYPLISNLELALVAPTLIALTVYVLHRVHLPHLGQAWGVGVPIPGEVVLATKTWSGILLVAYAYLVLQTRGEILFSAPFPYTASIILFVVSGIFIARPLAQSVFHVCSCCSWFGVMDLMVTCTTTECLLDKTYILKGLLTLMCASSVAVRYQHGNNWQYKDIHHASIGFIMTISYYWVLELPYCRFFESHICMKLWQSSASMMMHLGSNERLYALAIAVVIHLGFNMFCLLSVVHTPFYAEDMLFLGQGLRTASDPLYASQMAPGALSDQGRTVFDHSNGITVEDVTPSTTTPHSERASAASDSGQHRRNQAWSRASECAYDDHSVPYPPRRDDDASPTMGGVRLPPDCVEVSAAEAVRIVQYGLRHVDSTRAASQPQVRFG